VGVTAAADVEMLLGGARRRNSGIRELHDLRNPLIAGQVVYRDPPPAGAWRCIAHGQVAADRNHRRAHVEAADCRERLTRSVAFRNAADIEGHARLVQSDRAARRIQVQLPVTGAAGGLTQCVRVRHPLRAPRLSPQANHRSHRHVEGAVRLLGKIL
jgi:hypothetical protein